MEKNHHNKFLVVIAGPTAVGKTQTTIELAKYYNSVILSADSRQFYREMNIGTAKPDEEQLKAVKHFFINTKTVAELYGAGHFEKDAIALLNDLFNEHQIIFLTGGSGLYIDAVLNGVDEFDEIPDQIRETLNTEFESKGIRWLQEQIQEKDPDLLGISDQNNPQRLIRALEVITHTGKPYTSFLKKNKTIRNFIPIKILLNLERQTLYNRIENRVDQMLDMGLLQEVKNLVNSKNLNALKTVGYRELYEYMEGKWTFEEAVSKIKQHTRNYAKRQLTWFKNKDTFKEFDPSDIEGIKKYINERTQ